MPAVRADVKVGAGEPGLVDVAGAAAVLEKVHPDDEGLTHQA